LVDANIMENAYDQPTDRRQKIGRPA
jgi:hypothetical protein